MVKEKLIACGMISEEDYGFLFWEWGYKEFYYRIENRKRTMGFDLETFLRVSGQIDKHERAMLG